MRPERFYPKIAHPWCLHWNIPCYAFNWTWRLNFTLIIYVCLFFFRYWNIQLFPKTFSIKVKKYYCFFFFFFISLKIFETVLRSTMSSSRELFYELIIWLENHSEFVLYIVVYYLKTISRKHLSLCFRQTLFYAHKTFFFFFFYWRTGWFITSTVGAIQTTPRKVVGEDTPQHVGSLRQT